MPSRRQPRAHDNKHRVDVKRRAQALAQLADEQEGVVSRAQLYDLGFSRREIETLILNGWLVRLHWGVYIYGRQRIGARGRLVAALLATGPNAFLSHRSAAAHYGLRTVNPYEIHVTLPGRPRPRRGLRIHGTAKPLHPADVRTFRGLRVSTIARMLVELSSTETVDELRRLVTEAIRRNLFDLGATTEALDRHAGRPGLPKLRAAIHRYTYSPRDKSSLERAFAAFLSGCPEIPPPLRNVHLGPYEIDFLWPTEGLAVELDGRLYHEALKDRDRDGAKDSWLQRHGLRVLRITDFRFEHDRRSLRPELGEFLGLRRTDAAADRAA